MGVRTVGVEEELLLVDPATRLASSRSQEVLAEHHREHGVRPVRASHGLDKELFQHQLETRTEPTTDMASVRQQLLVARAIAGRAARRLGLAAVAVATVPLTDEPRLTPDDRYEDMLFRYAEIARHAGTCGMHVHVVVESDEEGVGVIDRVGPWLPVLRAVSANSPYAEGRDTGYASWRSQVWSHWPTAGPTGTLSSVAAYRRLCEELLESGAARDPGMLYFDARLSAHQPTVEVRVFDTCTDLDDAVLLAALVRALVEHVARSWRRGEGPPPWRTESLRAAHWRASRVGLASTLVHPLTRRLATAREVMEALLATVATELEETGDTELVRAGVERVLWGGGAVRQLEAYRRAGSLDGVVDDLVLRSEAVWSGLDAGVSPRRGATP
ncbi:carboxylate-amine ligase [Nocardioides sp. MAHUQ-72]|uniref:carboxylate-amine ligase n=1 Tax=unclassified Nocardioides TaxID=2615069 RepID=UPI0036232CF2